MKMSDMVLRIVAAQIGIGIALVIASVVLTPFALLAWKIVCWIWNF